MTEYYFIDKKTGAKKHSYFEGGEWREEVYHPPATAATKAKTAKKEPPARYVSSAIKEAGEAMCTFCMGELGILARPSLEFFRADGKRWGAYDRYENKILICDDISQKDILLTVAHEMGHAFYTLNLHEINTGAALEHEEAEALAYADRVVRGTKLMQGSDGRYVVVRK